MSWSLVCVLCELYGVESSFVLYSGLCSNFEHLMIFKCSFSLAFYLSRFKRSPEAASGAMSGTAGGILQEGVRVVHPLPRAGAALGRSSCKL